MGMPEESLLTRQTLLLRLRDPKDQRAWEEFVEIYTPLVYRFCRKRELNAADTADIVQEVMRSVSLAMKSFEYDPEKGKFKAWLFTAARNAVGKHFKKQANRPITASETKLLRMIEEAPEQVELDEWERDYQRRLLSWAMEKVKPEFAGRIWKAFEITAIEDRTPEEASREIGMTKNAVNIAKHRVMKRLREKAQSVDADRWEKDLIRERQKD